MYDLKKVIQKIETLSTIKENSGYGLKSLPWRKGRRDLLSAHEFLSQVCHSHFTDLRTRCMVGFPKLDLLTNTEKFGNLDWIFKAAYQQRHRVPSKIPYHLSSYFPVGNISTASYAKLDSSWWKGLDWADRVSSNKHEDVSSPCTY
jgi:hypothetical protein